MIEITCVTNKEKVVKQDIREGKSLLLAGKEKQETLWKEKTSMENGEQQYLSAVPVADRSL